MKKEKVTERERLIEADRGRHGDRSTERAVWKSYYIENIMKMTIRGMFRC